MMSKYKPYSLEWSRKRYLAEAIQQYLDHNVDVNFILEDIVSILEEDMNFHQNYLNKVQRILSEIKKLSD